MADIKFEKVTLKSGAKRWEGCAEGPAHPVTGKRQQIRRRGKTQSEVRAKILQALNELEGSTTDVKRLKSMTFRKACLDWFDLYKTTGVKQSTIFLRRYALSILIRYLGDAKIVNISPRQYQQFIRLIADKYSISTVRTINTTAGMVFKQAIIDGIIDKSPRAGVTLPRSVKTIEEIESDPIEEKYLSNEELEKFFEAVTIHGLDLDLERFYLLVFTGMRSSELCALKWSDINFRTNEIRISKNVYNEKGRVKEYELTTPKTIGSARIIDVDEKVMNLLKDYRKLRMQLDKEYKELFDDFHEENFVFSRPNGYPFSRRNIYARTKRIMRFVDIDKDVTPHTLRHTHISMQAEAGTDLKTIMQRVGHTDPDTTLKIYTHVTNKMAQRASKNLGSKYENILEKLTF